MEELKILLAMLKKAQAINSKILTKAIYEQKHTVCDIASQAETVGFYEGRDSLYTDIIDYIEKNKLKITKKR